MAFTSRAVRNTSLAAASTGDTVGPGSYVSSRKKTITGYAPFNSFAERKVGGDGPSGRNSADVPGPGTYQNDPVATKAAKPDKKPVSGSAFTSKTPRVAKQTPGSSIFKESTVAEVPGPGAYNLSKVWQPNVQPLPEHHALSIRHTQSAPSIPAPSQSYGYEEDELGELQMQGAPVKGYSGRGGRLWNGSDGDTVGPGRYTPNDAVTKTKAAGVTFGVSKSSRECKLFAGKTGPGAGDYNPTLAPKVVDSKKASSNFKTKTKRMTYLKDQKQTPGPGTYGYTDAFSKASMPQDENIQFFGSTMKRWYEVDESASYMTPFSQKTPGPGSYKMVGDIAKKSSKKRTSFLKSGDVGFCSTSSRQMGVLPESSVPGPGSYSKDNSQGEFTKELEQKVRSRTGAFLSSDDRFHNGPFDEKSETGPGPADYRPADGAAEEEGEKKRTLQKFPKQTSFLSHTERFVEQEKPVPPPGTYDIEQSWSPRNTTLASNKSFASSSARFNPKEVFSGVMMKEVPAPGDYDKIQTELPKTNAHKGFLSTQNRFTKKQATAPGPGQYRHQEGMIKRSFNVTIDI